MATPNTIKLLEFNPASGFILGDKIIYFADCPGGISFDEDHLNPVFSRRTQNGTLITQQVRYNKKNFTINLGIHSKELKTYFQTLYEAGINTELKVWNENETTYTPETEFNGTARLVGFTDNMDQGANIRSLTLTLMEV